MENSTRYDKDRSKGLKRAMPSTMMFGIIVGNRSGKVNPLVDEARTGIVSVIEKHGHRCICLSGEDTPSGSVCSVEDARKCALLFQQHAGEIDGIIVTLPNFGDERAIANSIRWSKLVVPVLVQAEPDETSKMGFGQRRDSFCGKISACANLKQYNIPFTLTKNHTCSVISDEFKTELDKFAAICRIVKGMTGARIGAIGARPASFNTVRYSEKILEYHGISVIPVDLSEIIGQVQQLGNDDRLSRKVEIIHEYFPAITTCIPAGAIEKVGKLLIVLETWIESNEIDAIAFQCWTSIERHLGIAPCGVLSMLTSNLIPAACEVDVLGALTMLVLQYASLKPAIILDCDNNLAREEEKCVVFHCSNIPKDYLESMTLENHFSPNFYPDKGFGAVFGKLRSNDITFARLTTNDVKGKLQFYSGRAKITGDELKTYGGYGVIHVEHLQALLHKICKHGFEHHFALTLGDQDDILAEALETYLGFDRAFDHA